MEKTLGIIGSQGYQALEPFLESELTGDLNNLGQLSVWPGDNYALYSKITTIRRIRSRNKLHRCLEM